MNLFRRNVHYINLKHLMNNTATRTQTLRMGCDAWSLYIWQCRESRTIPISVLRPDVIVIGVVGNRVSPAELHSWRDDL